MANGEKRSSKRAAVVLRIKLRYADVDELISKFAINISRTGLFVRSKKPKPPGTVIAFELRLAGGETAVRGRGTVRWTREFNPAEPRAPYGMGIAFSDLDDDSRELIEQMVAHKVAEGGEEVEGKIPNQLAEPEPAATEPEPREAAATEPEPPEAAAATQPEAPEAAPAEPEAPAAPEPAPAPAPAAEPPPRRVAAAPLPPEPPRPPRSSVKEVLTEAKSGPIDWPPEKSGDELMDSDVAVDDVLRRARQLAGADADLADLEADEPIEGPEASVEKARARLAALFGRPSPKRSGANGAGAEPAEPGALVDSGTELGLGELSARQTPPSEPPPPRIIPPEPPAPEPPPPPEPAAEAELPMQSPAPLLIDSDSEIESALEALAPMDPAPPPPSDPVAERAQASIDAAVDAADRLAAEHEILDENSEADPTFITDLPSAALASDLAGDSDNQLGAALDGLMEPEERLPESARLVHGVEDFLGQSPAHTSPIGVDIDRKMAELAKEQASPEPAAPAPAPASPRALSDPGSEESIDVDIHLPEDSLDIDLDFSEFGASSPEQAVPPQSAIGQPPPQSPGPALPGLPSSSLEDRADGDALDVLDSLDLDDPIGPDDPGGEFDAPTMPGPEVPEARETPELEDLPGARPEPQLTSRETPDLADLPGARPPPIPKPPPLPEPPPLPGSAPLGEPPMAASEDGEGDDKKKRGFFKRIFRKE